MLFQVYGDGSWIQWVGWVAAFLGLILLNEFTRKTKFGGIFMLGILPAAVTIYLVVIHIVPFASLPSFAQDTLTEMNSWFHYAKLYAALAGCIGFMFIKYEWGIGKQHWFKCFPFVIVAINIMIAVCSDAESAIHGFAAGGAAGGYWLSSEGVWLYGGWHNIFNALAGLLNIFGMTGWWGVYSSKDKNKANMMWPDMIWCYIIAYDIWNFAYTYNCLPTHSWYCGVALLLAPTVAAFLWNKGGWIMNRANTLFIWCTFAQLFPAFQNHSKFSVVPVLYPTSSIYDATGAVAPASANWYPMLVVSVLAFAANAALIAVIVARAKMMHKNPYTNEIFVGTKDFEKAMKNVAKANQ